MVECAYHRGSGFDGYCTQCNIESALELQRLIKKEIKDREHRGHKSIIAHHTSQLFAQKLQDLVNESELTQTTKGNAQ